MPTRTMSASKQRFMPHHPSERATLLSLFAFWDGFPAPGVYGTRTRNFSVGLTELSGGLLRHIVSEGGSKANTNGDGCDSYAKVPKPSLLHVLGS